MSSVVNEVIERQDRPAWVRFERVPVEDKKASLREGKWVGQDVDYVYITPPYSKDEVVKKVDAWLEQLTLHVQQGKILQSFMDRYVAQYHAWKNGQELPLDGTPIKGWGVISPAQQETLIHAKIRTVEDLAGINDEGMRHIGMGSFELKQKAVAWLAQLRDKGPLTVEMAQVKAENAGLKISIDTLTKQVQALVAQVQANVAVPVQAVPTSVEQITASDLLDPTPPEPVLDHVVKERLAKRPRGNPNWRKKTPTETPAA